MFGGISNTTLYEEYNAKYENMDDGLVELELLLGKMVTVTVVVRKTEEVGRVRACLF